MKDFRKRRNNVLRAQIDELERSVNYWDRVLRTSPDMHTREQAAIRGGEIKLEIAALKSQLGVS
jgi:hypothetical protein